MPIKPPKCKTCGVESWKHVCSGLGRAKARITEIAARPVTLGSKGKAKIASRTGTVKTAAPARAGVAKATKPKRQSPPAASAAVAPDKPKPPKPAPEKVEP